MKLSFFATLLMLIVSVTSQLAGNGPAVTNVDVDVNGQPDFSSNTKSAGRSVTICNTSGNVCLSLDFINAVGVIGCGPNCPFTFFGPDPRDPENTFKFCLGYTCTEQNDCVLCGEVTP